MQIMMIAEEIFCSKVSVEVAVHPQDGHINMEQEIIQEKQRVQVCHCCLPSSNTLHTSVPLNIFRVKYKLPYLLKAY